MNLHTQWLSVYRYAWGGMLANEMSGQMFLFDTEFEGEAVVLLAGLGLGLGASSFSCKSRNTRHHEGMAKAWCLLIHAGASISLPRLCCVKCHPVSCDVS